VTRLATQTAPDEAASKAVTLVDCDIHPVMLPAETSRRLSARWRRHLERYGRRSPHITDTYPRPRNQGMRADAWPEGGVPGSDLALLQHQLLDEHDIDFGILLALHGSDGYDPPELMAELNRAVNDWLVEAWLDRDDRLRASLCVPHDQPALAVAEIERRASDGRFVQVLFPASAQEPLGARKYWPIYEAAAAHGLPVAIHTGGYYAHRGTGWPSFYLEEHAGYGTIMQLALTSLVCEGALAAIPDLKLVLTEGGAAWAAALRWRLDEAWSLLHDETPLLERPPSEYISEQVWFDTQPIEEPDDPGHFMDIIQQADLTDRLMFATDYPHWEFDSPTQTLPRGVPKELREKIFAGTACDLYGLPRTRDAG
jgi:uncharacterized protein